MQLFYLDHLTMIMMGLAGFVALCIASFSSRYLKGDRKQGSFYAHLVLMILSSFMIFAADNIFVLLGTWGLSNFLLTKLMQHKKEWQAAKNSARLALKNFTIGLFFISNKTKLHFCLSNCLFMDI